MIFQKKETQSPDDFWGDREKEKGGPVGFRSFSMLLGKSDDTIRNLAGIFYQVGDTMYFEDFEKDNMLAKLINRGRKYEKTEFSFNLSEVLEMRLVSKNAALACIDGSLEDRDTKPMTALASVFGKAVVQLLFVSGYSLFFEVMEMKGIKDLIQKPPQG